VPSALLRIKGVGPEQKTLGLLWVSFHRGPALLLLTWLA
jgi:hypothetical protein